MSAFRSFLAWWVGGAKASTVVTPSDPLDEGVAASIVYVPVYCMASSELTMAVVHYDKSSAMCYVDGVVASVV